jgi:hypothetical protein
MQKMVNYYAIRSTLPLLPYLLPHCMHAQGGLLAAFQGGQAAGLGVASVISGEYNPSGKL